MTRCLLALVVLATLASASTQVLALVTGRAFIFGLVPAFDPAGTRNLIVWQSSMLLALCAGVAVLVAGIPRPRRGHAARAWYTVAVLFLLMSLAWMTNAAGLLMSGVVPAVQARRVLVMVTTLVGALALTITRRPMSAAVPRWAWLALPLLLAAVGSDGSPWLGAATTALVGRIFEWLGATLFLMGGVMLLADVAPQFILRVEDHGASAHRPVDDEPGVVLTLSPLAVWRGLCVLVAVLAVVSLASAWLVRLWGTPAEPWYRFLFVDFEGNLPTWATAVLLLACAAAAAVVAATVRGPHPSDWRYWMLMSVALVALSADEAASLHELLVGPLRALVGGSPWLRYPLILPGLGVVVAAGVVFGRFILRLPAETRRAVVAGGALFVFGALVIETIGGWFDPVLYGDNLPYVLLSATEEACEMVGVAMVLVGLLRHIERHSGEIRVHASGVPARPHPANDSVVASAAGPGRPAALRLL